jgi:serine/threonine protein kinase
MGPLPSQIGRYQIKSLIGRGGMGDLYLAHDPNTSRLVALKLLNATLDSSELRERFAREARALAALNHPNIVNIYDTGEFEDSPFIVMEYVRGETLAELIKRRATLTVSQKLKLICELCAGLAQAHEAGIIHRDIKPANLMVDQQGRLKILDFGIARVAEGNRTRFGLPLTQVNMMIGTPGYMSPEQIEGGEVDHRSDIFAVGAVCYELLSYDEAFSGTNTVQIEKRVLEGQPAPLSSRVPGLDPEIDEIVLRALKRDPNKRYQDAATFERALERVRSRIGPDAPGPPRRPTPQPPSARVKSREARAEAAYQRALTAYHGSATEAARRFAVEALAEDPSHAKARAFLARLEPRPPLPGTSQSVSPGPPLPAGPPIPPGPLPPTVISTSVSKPASTMASAPTLVSTSASQAPPTIASAPTILVTPRAARAPARWKQFQTLWSSGGPLKKRYEQLTKRDYTSPKRPEPFWPRYRRTLLAVALLVIVAGIVAIVIRFGLGLRPSGQLLTITKPLGGTISAAGINCGTRGADCSINRPNGDPIELTPEADAGFTFVGYTGDCAPGGRTIMTMPRTCGATFTRVVAAGPAVGATQPLTIAPVPTGGTLEGVDIICGTKGSVCSVNHPEGVPVELHPTADPGFTFMGFLGDCVPLGHTQMTGPRTCGATFSPTAVVAAAPPPVPPSGGARGGRSGRGVVSPQPTTEAPTSPASPTSRPSPPSPPTAPVAPGAPAAPGAVADLPPAAGPKQVPPPITDEAFAKGKIQELLKEWCLAYEAIDPAAVQRVQPKVNLDQLRKQLNTSQYRSVQCKFAGDPVFVSLDPSAGTATVQAELKRIYEHTILTEKPHTDELVAVMTLFRSNLRSPWLIDAVTYKPKPK